MGMDDGPGVRRLAVVVLVLLVGTGLWVGSRGDPPVRLLTAALFGLSALGLAWKLWSSRNESGPGITAPFLATDTPDAARTGEAVPSGPWRVYGHDTFAREDYFIGEFDTEAEAREVARQKSERLAKFQDKPLRDEVLGRAARQPVPDARQR